MAPNAGPGRRCEGGPDNVGMAFAQRVCGTPRTHRDLDTISLSLGLCVFAQINQQFGAAQWSSTAQRDGTAAVAPPGRLRFVGDGAIGTCAAAQSQSPATAAAAATVVQRFR